MILRSICGTHLVEHVGGLVEAELAHIHVLLPHALGTTFAVDRELHDDADAEDSLQRNDVVQRHPEDLRKTTAITIHYAQNNHY